MVVNCLPKAPEGADVPIKQLADIDLPSSPKAFIDLYEADTIAWCLTRLSGTDTIAVGARLAGPGIPKALLMELFPGVDKGAEFFLNASLPQQRSTQRVQVVAFKKIFFQKVREESRLAGWGDGSSLIMKADSTGSLAAFAFLKPDSSGAHRVAAWVCRDEHEEADFERWAGPVAPGCPSIIRGRPSAKRSALPEPSAFADAVAQKSPKSNGSLEARLMDLYGAAFAAMSGTSAAGAVLERWKDQVTASLLHRALREYGISAEITDLDDPSLRFGSARDPSTPLRVRTVIRYGAPDGLVFTTQQGLSQSQFMALSARGPTLIIPSVNLPSFPASTRSRLTIMEDAFRA